MLNNLYITYIWMDINTQLQLESLVSVFTQRAHRYLKRIKHIAERHTIVGKYRKSTYRF